MFEPRLLNCTMRDTINDYGLTAIDLECRFDDGQKIAAVTVDGEFPELAKAICDCLNKLSKKNGEGRRETMESKGKRNAYQCQECQGRIITENRIELVTPFMVGCRVDSECEGMMHSAFYPEALQYLLARRTYPTTHYWESYTEEEIQAFRDDGNTGMVEWATTCHGKLVEKENDDG